MIWKTKKFLLHLRQTNIPHETYWHEFCKTIGEWLDSCAGRSTVFVTMRERWRPRRVNVNSSRAARLSVHELRPVRGRFVSNFPGDPISRPVLRRAIYRGQRCRVIIPEDRPTGNDSTVRRSRGQRRSKKHRRRKRTFHSEKIVYTWQSRWIPCTFTETGRSLCVCISWIGLKRSRLWA